MMCGRGAYFKNLFFKKKQIVSSLKLQNDNNLDRVVKYPFSKANQKRFNHKFFNPYLIFTLSF